MKKNIDKLKSFSEIFNIAKEDVERLGFFDITLSIDSKLYIDPKLLTDNNALFFVNAKSELKKFFENLVTIISKIKKPNDVFWEAANKMLTFKEIHGTCLGYSDSSIYGRSFGPAIRKDIIERVKALTDDGNIDSNLLELLPIFTNGFGCDLSSDLITFAIKDVIFEYNLKIIEELRLQDKDLISYMGKKFLKNPFKEKLPILLLPKNILSDLPLCDCFEDISNSTYVSEEVRKNLQSYIEIKSDDKKDQIYNFLLTNRDILKTLLYSYANLCGKNYDFETDSLCLSKFREIIKDIETNDCTFYHTTEDLTKLNSYEVSKKCIELFRKLIENKGGRKAIQKFNEKGIQFLFFASSYYFCKVNGVDILPEVNCGSGPVDFLFTNGTKRISVEFKLSKNPDYIHGLQKQLPEYMANNDSVYGFFVFMNFSSETSVRIKRINDAKNSIDQELRKNIEICIVQCDIKPSASRI